MPIWEKYTLTIEKASKYFRIGEKKLRKLAGREKTDCKLADYEWKPCPDKKETI